VKVKELVLNNQEILIERQGYIGYVILNRPEKLNALTWNMYALIRDAMDELEVDESVRVIIIKGAGRAFSAGFDLNEPGLSDHQELRRGYDRIAHAARHKIWNIPKPTIAQIHGYCMGGAHDVALACDIAIATEDAKMGVPEIKFGMGATFLLMPWILGLRKTKELLLTGKTITGREAAEIGLVNYATPPEKLEEKVLAMAKELAVIPIPAMQLQKRGINRAIEISGFSAASEIWIDMTCLGSLWHSPEIDEFNQIVKEKGLKAALAWREERFELGKH
jgi:enoyl-CoA hydratase/carnithine racemase